MRGCVLMLAGLVVAVLLVGCDAPKGKLESIDEIVGQGETAQPGDTIVVHYTGKLKNGRVFDSSHDNGEPFVLLLGAGKVIRGWDEGIPGMKEGGKRKLVIPSDMAYGEKGSGRTIPPNAELQFDVELIKVLKVDKTDEKVGEGRTAKPGDTVVVHYTGTLKDGTKFDSSRDRNKPFEFQLGAGEVIKGWDQGVVGMKVGGVRKLVIPSDLAYGARGRPPVIPPNSELTFGIELLNVK